MVELFINKFNYERKFVSQRYLIQIKCAVLFINEVQIINWSIQSQLKKNQIEYSLNQQLSLNIRNSIIHFQEF